MAIGIDNTNGTVLVTGAAGFVGASLCRELLRTTQLAVVGYDDLNDYYDVALKRERLAMVREAAGEGGRFTFVQAGLEDAEALNRVFAEHNPQLVVNLAAQAGVRWSIDHPRAYVDANLVGFFNVLEACRNNDVRHLIYASSSSVYGKSAKTPFGEDDMTDEPVSLYAATKKADELLAHSYTQLFGFPATGLRLFTVYGPAGRPDMAYFKFALKMAAGEPIQLYNHGDMLRDFTYIDDVVHGIILVIEQALTRRPSKLHRVYNLGHGNPVELREFVQTLENRLRAHGVIDRPADIELLPLQPGDVLQTYADTSKFQRDFGFAPSTGLFDGLDAFAAWFAEYTAR